MHSGNSLKPSQNLTDCENIQTAFENIKRPATETFQGVVELAANGEVAANLVVQSNDARLSNDRNPILHANYHENGGIDPIKLDDLNPPDDNTDLNTTILAHGLCPRLSGNNTHALRGDGTWAAPVGMGDMLSALNLSDVANTTTSFNNIKQAATTTYTGVVELATDGEVAANVVVQGNDSRLNNARTPVSHHTTHESGGADAIKLDDLAAPDNNTDLNASVTAHGLMPKLDGSIQSVMQGTGAWVSPSSMGYLRHTNNLSDVSSAATSFGNIKQAATTTATGVVELATDGEVGANLVVQANDSRLSDSRTPTGHHASHESGGGDAIKLDDLSAPDNNTDLNATTSAHGLCPKGDNDTTHFLRGDLTWQVPAGGTGGWSYPMDFRLTLESGVPISTTDQTGKTTLYMTPIRGDCIALYYSSAWVLKNTAEISIAVPASTDTNYDVWAYWDNGTTSVKLELLAWSNATTRATALAYQNGVLVKSGDATRRYIGSMRTTSSSGQCEDSETKRFVYNYYHQVLRKLKKVDTTDSWTYNSNTFHQANANSANQVEILSGWAEGSHLDLTLVSAMLYGNGMNPASSIGEDVTNASSADILSALNSNGAAVEASIGIAKLTRHNLLGYHYYAWVERAIANTCTFFGDYGGAVQSGLIGSIRQ